MNTQDFDPKELTKTLKIDAIGVGIPSGAASSFVKATVTAVEKQLSTKKTITKNDLERIVAKELKKYNADLAYVYQNRDTIV
ncbi:hypothetical protein IJG26_00020 [Candidatus Saccharibacteria bacterium]|nr:hypothetical protein [Candidatus Saccharibacteria bacterium]